MSGPFTLHFTSEAQRQLAALERETSAAKRLKAVRKALGLMEINLRHPSLNTHKYQELTRLMGKEVFESYAEHKTPAAYRIFWHYGPGRRDITVLAITSHP